MKRQLFAFLSGAFTTALISALSLSALAISGRMSIEVDPINIQVNGEVFAPTDASGAPVPVFAYNGTTYAPLRALAEAYGLEVGYDPERNMAMVGEVVETSEVAAVSEEETYQFDYSYEEFKALWEDREPTGTAVVYCKDDNTTKAWLGGVSKERCADYFQRLARDIVKADIEKIGSLTNPGVLFKYRDKTNIAWAWGYEEYIEDVYFY